MKTKATFISKFYDSYNKNFVLTYEYRGCKYEVIDYAWRGGEPLSWQHNNEQAKIDQHFDNLKNKTTKPSESRPFNMDEIFELLEWDS